MLPKSGRGSLLVAFALCVATTPGRAGETRKTPGGADTEGVVIPFKEARIYIEFNSTDNDLGFHTSLDAEDWSDLRIVKPDGKTVFQVKGKGSFGTLGMTELFFEGAEPSLDEFPLDELLALFPEGKYRFLGRTVNGETLDSTWDFTHLYPGAPVIHSPIDGEIVDPANLVVDWDSVTSPAGVRILEYEVIIGALDPVMKSSMRVPASVTSLKIPREILLSRTDYEFEVVAVEVNRSQTLTTGSFSTP